VTKDDEYLCVGLDLRAWLAELDEDNGLARDLRKAAERIRTLGSASLPKVGYESYESLGMATRTGVTRDAKEIKPEQAISYTKSADMDQDIDPAVEALVKRKIAERDWRILKYGRDIEYL
jgi:hypothetical protein